MKMVCQKSSAVSAIEVVSYWVPESLAGWKARSCGIQIWSFHSQKKGGRKGHGMSYHDLLSAPELDVVHYAYPSISSVESWAREALKAAGGKPMAHGMFGFPESMSAEQVAQVAAKIIQAKPVEVQA